MDCIVYRIENSNLCLVIEIALCEGIDKRLVGFLPGDSPGTCLWPLAFLCPGNC
jgi:hypothetical protein